MLREALPAYARNDVTCTELSTNCAARLKWCRLIELTVNVLQANEYVRRNFLPTLQPLMPLALPSSFRTATGNAYASHVRAALAKTFETLNADFSARGELAGCTMTAALITGGLLTVANVGDSDAVLDTFAETIAMTVPHRVNDHEEEQRRVEDAGAHLLPTHASTCGTCLAPHSFSCTPPLIDHVSVAQHQTRGSSP